MSKYKFEEMIHKIQSDFIKYGSFVHTLSQLDPLSENFKQMEAFALKMKKEQDDHIKYGSFAHTLSQLDPLSESFKQMEAFALKMKKEQDDHIKYGGFTHTLSQLNHLSENLKVEINPSDENYQTYINSENPTSFLLAFVIALSLSISNSLPNTTKKITSSVIFDIAIAITFEYLVKPHIDNLMKNSSNAEPSTTTENLRNFLLNKRITTHPIELLEQPTKKSSIIESLPPQTLITVIPDKTIPKSWLKIKITLDQSEVEGYVLRRYTSPIR
ncbi:hypothetical protein [Acinetobacter indicus]|uniref:hypothetical protein n=1 Tax=Acinetobacter indicus TaxID=756892 RepID=UPI00209B6FE3|nr:hypothetical protein [Acinetobacter indicus]MCO8088588.1 hypothetical protein [Acinetobacter indicus]